MSQDVLHFQCSTCHAPLTVPIQLAGVTGPCPKCGVTVTSPSAPPPPAPVVPVQLQVPVPPMPDMGPMGGLHPNAQPDFPTSPPAGMMPPASPPIFPSQASMPPPQMVVPPAAAPVSPPMAGGWGMPEMQPPGTAAPMQPQAVPPQLEQLLQPQAPAPALSSLPGVAAVPVQNDPLMQAGSLLPPRRLEGQLPASGSLMNTGGMGGFGPMSGGLTPPSPSPQWNLPGTGMPPPPSSMPRTLPEDPMATILQGTNPPPSPLSSPSRQVGSELDDEPKRPQPAASNFPQQAASPAPVSIPPQAMNIRLSGAKRGKGKLVGALAALFLLGGIGGAAWYFREPLGEIAQRYLKSKSSDSGTEQSPDATASASSPSASENAAAETANSSPGTSAGGFDPTAKQPDPESPRGKTPPLLGDGKPTVPIVIDNANSPSPTPEPPPATVAKTGATTGSSILGSSVPRPPPTEIKPAGSPDGGPAVSSMSAVPKAIIAEDPLLKSPAPVTGTAGEKPVGNPLLPPPSGEASPKGTAPEMPGDTNVSLAASAVSGMATGDAAVVQTSPEGKKAAADLQAFFAAKNLEERLPLTLGGEAVKSHMQRYYAKRDPGPVPVDEIRLLRFDPKPQTGGGPHCVFTVSSKQWEYPIPVMLQEEGGKFKVDWMTFVEFRDDLLREFLSDFQEFPVQFHVGISRSHYFEDDVPDLEGKDCFKIEPPVPTYVGYVFVPKGTPLAADLSKRITWEALTAFVVVELRWKQQGNMKWVELTGVPQLNWYSIPAEPKAASGDASQKKGGAMNIQKPKSKAKQ